VLSSPRLRRRLLWAGTGVVAAGAVALAVVLWPRAKEEPVAAPPGTDIVLEVSAEAPEVPLTAETRAAVLDVAQRFLTSAVVRERLAASWELAHPDLRQGLTRREWTAGDIPVVPYPVDTARWRLGYSQQGIVGLEVYVLPKAGSRIRPMVFDMEVKASGSGAARRWLVSNWAPRVNPGGPAPPEPSPERLAAERAAQEQADENTLGAAWLLAPVAAFLCVLALPVVLALRDRRRDRLGERLHAQHGARRDDRES
jgi:hypothetical protein